MAFRERICEACGRDFGCGAEVGGCWCNDVTLDAQTLAELRARYDACLCPTCLRALATGDAAGGDAAGRSAGRGPAARG